jgi:hypothetical protein
MVQFEPGDDSLGIRLLIAVLLLVGVMSLVSLL